MEKTRAETIHKILSDDRVQQIIDGYIDFVLEQMKKPDVTIGEINDCIRLIEIHLSNLKRLSIQINQNDCTRAIDQNKAIQRIIMYDGKFAQGACDNIHGIFARFCNPNGLPRDKK